MTFFCLGQIAQKFFHLRVVRLLSSFGIKSIVLQLNELGTLAHRLNAALVESPCRRMLYEPVHIGAANERNEVTKFLLV